MIPSLVASEVSQTLSDFVKTQFQPSNPRMAAVVTNFLDEPGSLLKGPYLSLSLPFQAASEGGSRFRTSPSASRRTATSVRPSTGSKRAAPLSSALEPAPARPSASCSRSSTTAGGAPTSAESRPS